MPSIINASSSGSGGIVQTADASGVLQLQSNGTAFLSSSGGNTGFGTATIATNFRAQFLGTAGSNNLPASSGTTQAASAILRLQAGGGFTATLDIGQAGGNGSWLQSCDTANLATTYPLTLNPNGGSVCIGTTSSLGARLALYGTSGGSDSNIQITNPGYGTGCIGVNGTSSNFKIYNCYSTGTIGSGKGIDIDTNGYFFLNYMPTTANGANCNISTGEGNKFYVSTSALKYKQDIRDIESIDINLFRPVRYKSRCEGDDQTKDFFGFVADEVHDAGVTELISYGADGEVNGFQYDRLTVVLVKTIQEQQAIIDQLKADVAALKAGA